MTNTGAENAAAAPKRVRVSQTEVPRHILAAALRVAQALEDRHDGNASAPIMVAESVGNTPLPHPGVALSPARPSLAASRTDRDRP